MTSIRCNVDNGIFSDDFIFSYLLAFQRSSGVVHSDGVVEALLLLRGGLNAMELVYVYLYQRMR